jgi:hypothetical protein
MISPQSLYRYCESDGIHFDTLDRILLDHFLNILEIFITINTPAGHGNKLWSSKLQEKRIVGRPKARWNAEFPLTLSRYVGLP